MLVTGLRELLCLQVSNPELGFAQDCCGTRSVAGRAMFWASARPANVHQISATAEPSDHSETDNRALQPQQ